MSASRTDVTHEAIRPCTTGATRRVGGATLSAILIATNPDVSLRPAAVSLGRIGEHALDVRRQLSIVRAWLPLVVASVVLAGAAAFYVSSLLPKSYEAKATLIVGQSLSGVNPDYTQLLASQSLSRTYAAVATTRPVLGRVIDKLQLGDSVDELAHRVTASAATDGTLLTITGTDSSPDGAAALANAVADELIAASPTVQGQQTDVLQSVDEYLKVRPRRDRLDPGGARPAERRGEPDDRPGDALRDAAEPDRQPCARPTRHSSHPRPTMPRTTLSVVEPAVAPIAAASPSTAPERLARGDHRLPRRGRDRLRGCSSSTTPSRTPRESSRRPGCRRWARSSA